MNQIMHLHPPHLYLTIHLKLQYVNLLLLLLLSTMVHTNCNNTSIIYNLDFNHHYNIEEFFFQISYKITTRMIHDIKYAHIYKKFMCKKFTLLPSASFFLAFFCDNGERDY